MSVCRFRLILIVATLIATGFGATAAAQTPPAEIPLQLGQRYWITQTDGVEIQGHITGRTPTDVQISTDRGHVTIPTANVLLVTKPDGLKNGALIGAGVGAGLIFLSMGSDHSGVLGGTTAVVLFAGTFGATGAIIGALLDVLVAPRQTVYRKTASTPSVQLAPTMLKGGLGVRGTVRW